MLTDEQKNLVDNNHNLIYFVLHKMNLPVEDYYDIAAIGMCKAAEMWDSSVSKFTTLAVVSMRNEILSSQRYERSKCRNNSGDVSLDAPIGDDCESITFLDNRCAQDEYRATETWLAVQGLMQSCLTERQRTVLMMCLSGYSIREMALALKTSEGNVKRLIGAARKKMRKFRDF